MGADLARVALVLGAELRIYDDTGSLLHAESLVSSSNALALSGDGRTLAVGSGARLRVLTESGGSWQFARELSAAAGEIAARVGLSDDGATLQNYVEAAPVSRDGRRAAVIERIVDQRKHATYLSVAGLAPFFEELHG